ncbi:acyl transferase [Cryomorphaceae bacterium]|nr:acyl transferase [Cryomorphaceae bacterium]
MDPVAFKNKLFRCADDVTPDTWALELFHWQAEQVPPYAEYLKHLGVNHARINRAKDIPYFPVEMFKAHEVKASGFPTIKTFSSSGTTGQVPSLHHVVDLEVYEQSYLNTFRSFYGDPKEYVVFALLPSYLERSGSSLIDMAQGLISRSEHPDSGFFLNDLKALKALLTKHLDSDRKILLLGVSFALLDLAEQYPIALPENAVVMETGGMKGRRKEMIRTELHQILKEAFNLSVIHSEYGMTELLSQAYAPTGRCFRTPPWMRLSLRDTEDPLSPAPPGKTGGVNVMDLANIYSCAFIATQDLGRPCPTGGIEILGRFDNAEVRGCNLMVQ